jgi:hypothetical protein
MSGQLFGGLFFLTCLMTAAASWLGGAYSVYRGMRALPDGHVDVPFFSTDPKLISDEVRKWRGRIYLCAAYFGLSLFAAVATRGM